MVKRKTAKAAAAAKGHSNALQRRKEKKKMRTDWGRKTSVPTHLIARPVVPKSKHHSYFEFAENTDKKKKIEYLVTDKKEPSAGFTFVPIGNPELTNACKELSREDGALMYIVSGRKEAHAQLGEHVHRIGYHFRTGIVEKAAESLGQLSADGTGDKADIQLSSTDRIPDTQEEINKQADAAIRDLFPRIPNTDRAMIIQHAFSKSTIFHGKPVVGLQDELSLSRRVQLAVIAHIRHTHTRYDLLLRETSWENARKAVESLCLDILVKWRGDEETGRDQLDEVLREIVVISDTEDEEDTDEDEDDDEEEESSSNDEVMEVSPGASPRLAPPATKQISGFQEDHSRVSQRAPSLQGNDPDNARNGHPGIASRTRSKTKPNGRQARNARRDRKRFERYAQAVSRRQEAPFQEAWEKGASTPSLPVAITTLPPNPGGFHRTIRDYNDEQHPLNERQAIAGLSRVSPMFSSHVNLPAPRTSESWRKEQLGQRINSPVRRGKQVIMNPSSHDIRDSQTNFLPRSPDHHSRPESFQVVDQYPNGPHRYVSQPVAHRPVQPLHDRAIPSIEPVADLDDVASASIERRRIMYEQPGFSEVGYLDDRHKLQSYRQPPSRPEIIYIDDASPRQHRPVMEDNEARYIDKGQPMRYFPRLYPGEQFAAVPNLLLSREGGVADQVGDRHQKRHLGPEAPAKRTGDLHPSFMGLSLNEAACPGHYRQVASQGHKRQRLEDRTCYEPGNPIILERRENQIPIDSRQNAKDSNYNPVSQGYQKRLAPESFYSMSSSFNDHHLQEMSSVPSTAVHRSFRPSPISRSHPESEARVLLVRNQHDSETNYQRPLPYFEDAADRLKYRSGDMRGPTVFSEGIRSNAHQARVPARPMSTLADLHTSDPRRDLRPRDEVIILD